MGRAVVYEGGDELVLERWKVSEMEEQETVWKNLIAQAGVVVWAYGHLFGSQVMHFAESNENTM